MGPLNAIEGTFYAALVALKTIFESKKRILCVVALLYFVVFLLNPKGTMTVISQFDDSVVGLSFTNLQFFLIILSIYVKFE